MIKRLHPKFKRFLAFSLAFQSISLAASAVDNYPDFFLGKNGWVISKSEYTDLIKLRDATSFWPSIHFKLLGQMVKALEAKNIRVIVAVVPQRFNAYPQNLPTDLYNEYSQGTNSYENTLKQVEALGVKTTDILSAEKNSKYYASKAGLYYRFEPHWNFYGASVAADAVTKEIKANFPDLKLPRKNFTLAVSEPKPRKDTIWLDQLPKDVQSTVPKDLEIPYTLKSPASSNDLLSDDLPQAVVVGTSFTGYGFITRLAFDMQADIQDQSLAGKGMWTPMAQYLSGDSFAKNPPKLIIWEMPEYILSNYPMPTDDEYKIFKSMIGVEKN